MGLWGTSPLLIGIVFSVLQLFEWPHCDLTGTMVGEKANLSRLLIGYERGIVLPGWMWVVTIHNRNQPVLWKWYIMGLSKNPPIDYQHFPVQMIPNSYLGYAPFSDTPILWMGVSKNSWLLHINYPPIYMSILIGHSIFSILSIKIRGTHGQSVSLQRLARFH